MTAQNTIAAGAPVSSPFSSRERREDIAAIADDMAMLRAVTELTRDLQKARPEVYWPDFLLFAAIGYAGLAAAILLNDPLAVAASGIVAVFALYRAALFIHELTHLRDGALPGFRLVWNMLAGVPLLLPSFMYEEVHTQHHQRIRYGTIEDPEYLPLALMKPWTLPLFILVAALAPIGLLLRFGVLTPLGLIAPKLRIMVRERYSALSINPAYRRRAPKGELRRQWLWQEAGCSIAAIAMMGSVTFLGWRPLLTWMAVVSVIAVVNQLRTLVAHLWENEGEAITVTAQFLDSVNVPPPAMLAPLWAPVGLRYHALHHLLPSLPYHSLGEAHRRLKAELGATSTYQQANYPGLWMLIGRLARSTMRVG